MTVDQFLKPITLLSLSVFPVLGKNIAEMIEQCHHNDTKVNFNYMVVGNEQDNKFFEMGCRYADQIYLVLKKPALGDVVPPDDLTNWLKARELAKMFAGKNPQKVIEDHCVMDALTHLHTRCLCPAGATKRHVWPDGKMTDCPYDSHQICGDEEHPMAHCKISEAISELKKRGNLSLQNSDSEVY
jgi:hypothetical protein